MAVAPYVMSIRKDHDAEESYQKIYDLVIFSSSLVVVGIVLLSPFLTYVLADETYLDVIYVIPLMAFAKVLSLAANQFSISFNLIKRNIYILYSVVLAGFFGIAINFLFMKDFGYIVSGYSQIFSYFLMSVFLFFVGKKVANLKIKLKNSFIITIIVLAYIFSLIITNPLVLEGKYFLFIIINLAFLSIITSTYLKQQKLTIRFLLHSVLNRRKKI